MDYKRQTPIQSREVGCCGARTWALVIGWIQTISSAFVLLLAIVFYAVVKEFVREESAKGATDDPSIDKEDREKAIAIVSIITTVIFVVTIIALVLDLAGGIILIMGVKQQNAQKIKVWYVIQIIFLVFAVIMGILSFIAGGFGVLNHIFGILITIFCMWVVNIHRQEILLSGAAGGGSANFAGMKA